MANGLYAALLQSQNGQVDHFECVTANTFGEKTNIWMPRKHVQTKRSQLPSASLSVCSSAQT
jgi:hypothetical protein